MNTTKLIFLCFIFCTCVKAQWDLQQVPTSNDLYDVYFSDSIEGWVTGSDGIFHTVDSGNNWEIQYQGTAYRLSGLINNELWATGLLDTLLHSTNGGNSWNKIALNQFSGLDSVRYIDNVYFYDNTVGWAFIIGRQPSGVDTVCILKTMDGGINWTKMIDPLVGYGSYPGPIQFLDSLIGYCTGSEATPVFKTTNGGESWYPVGGVGYMTTYGMQFVTENVGWITIDGPVNMTSIMKTTDGGVNWFNNIFCFCYILHPYFVDTLKGWSVQGSQIIHTIDGGLNWNVQYNNIPISPRKIFFVDSLNGWIIGYYGGIMHTSTGGFIPVEFTLFSASILQNEKVVQLDWTTATEINNSGFEIQRSEIRGQPAGGEVLPEGGKSEPAYRQAGWEKVGFVKGHGTTTEPRSYSFKDNNITAGTYKYRLKQFDFDGSFQYSEEINVEVDFTPQEFVLYQNYPNPFNPSTTIKYSIPSVNLRPAERGKQAQSDIFVSLKVYDILGNEIATLVNEEKQPGIYEVEFNPESSIKYPASGVYFYQLKAGSYSSIKKMILLK